MQNKSYVKVLQHGDTLQKNMLSEQVIKICYIEIKTRHIMYYLARKKGAYMCHRQSIESSIAKNTSEHHALFGKFNVSRNSV